MVAWYFMGRFAQYCLFSHMLYHITALDLLLHFVSLQEKHEPLDKHGELVVTFAFLRQQEFVQKHSRLLFREGRVKGTGVVTKLNPGAPAPQTRTRKPTN